MDNTIPKFVTTAPPSKPYRLAEESQTLLDDTTIDLAPPKEVIKVKLKLQFKGEMLPAKVNWDEMLTE